ncbi:MAG: zf-HC2 domain-containing protein [Anaerolineae bacterium]
MANVSEQDHELLSAYVDGMLTEEERLALETRLHSDPDLLHELTALYLTLAMIKQLPTLTAPRNFTLPAAPARWLIFPATPVFSALSAAAATFLVALGFILLLSTLGGAAAPQVAQNQEVALMSNQTSSGGQVSDDNQVNPQSLTSTANVIPGSVAGDTEAPVVSATLVALPTQAFTFVPGTATVFTFAATQTINNYAATAEPPTANQRDVDGLGGGVPMTATVVDTFAINAAASDESQAADASIAMVPLSTGTTLPTMTFIPPMATPAADAQIASDSAAETGMTLRTTEPVAPPMPEESESAGVEAAQMPTASPTATSSPTAESTTTPAPTATPAPTVTVTPAAQVTSVPSGSIPAILGLILVLGGAVLFGIAFMTAVARRGERRRATKEGQ